MSSTLEEYLNRNSQTVKHSSAIDSFNRNNIIRKFGSYLPNLRYKNGDVYYIPSHAIKLKSSKSKTGHYYQHEFKISNLQLNGRLDIYNNIYDVDIIPKYFDNGLQINVKYNDPYDTLDVIQQQKIARVIEYRILGINMFKSYYENNSYKDDIDYGIDDILYDHFQTSDNNNIFLPLYDVSYDTEYKDESIENVVEKNDSENNKNNSHDEDNY